MPFEILDTCIGCTACLSRCPTDAITGATKELHRIDPAACIDCGVCATYCPVLCIVSGAGRIIDRIRAPERPVARVDQIHCTGCEFCADICPFGCLEMTGNLDGSFFKVAEMTDPRHCVACRLCEEVCIKDCIQVLWPDGTRCETFPESSQRGRPAASNQAVLRRLPAPTAPRQFSHSTDPPA